MFTYLSNDMWYYLSVFFASLLVDILPFIGPPAWTVMVFFQMKYDLNIWYVLIFGVSGSAIGRYILFLYIPYLSNRYIKLEKNEDLHFIGKKLASTGWKIQAFVFLYTLMPLPSTTLFSAAGIAKIKAIYIVPTFLIGKFLSDLLMVVTGDYVTNNTANFLNGLLSWKSISGIVLGISILCLLLFVDWKKLLLDKKFSINIHIFK